MEDDDGDGENVADVGGGGRKVKRKARLVPAQYKSYFARRPSEGLLVQNYLD